MERSTTPIRHVSDLERAIIAASDKAGARPPKVTHFANCLAVSFRNGDGAKVLITFDHDAKPETAEQRIAQAYKVQSSNQPSEEAMRRFAEESAEEAHERISKLAGLDTEGNILPPPDGAQIDRSPSPFWKNK